MSFKAIVIGVSSGGMNAMKTLLPALPKEFRLPVIILQHIGMQSDNAWIGLIQKALHLTIKEADEKESIENGTIYVAPPGYHLLIERNGTFSLSIEERVNFAIPSIDVLFESAADAYGNGLIGIILTGANNDGAMGLKRIKEYGGLTIVQDPDTAESFYMPSAAIALSKPDYILPLDDIAGLLIKIDKNNTDQYELNN
ncbi:MAG TPA: chemotaxis protein CheB [Chitinophagales bacterium]|nr:chemotaxis protein CheB [Chitinophagales bacterium]